MRKLNFWPLWYRNKIEKRNYLKFKICVLIILVGIGINIVNFINYRNNSYNNMRVIQNYTKIKSDKAIKNEELLKLKINNIKKYTYFMKNIDKKINVDFIKIEDEKKQLSIEKNCKNSEEVNNVLDIIQKDSKCKIVSMNIKRLNENKCLLELKLEEDL